MGDAGCDVRQERHQHRADCLAGAEPRPQHGVQVGYAVSLSQVPLAGAADVAVRLFASSTIRQTANPRAMSGIPRENASEVQ
jgi:hypothetical protein